MHRTTFLPRALGASLLLGLVVAALALAATAQGQAPGFGQQFKELADPKDAKVVISDGGEGTGGKQTEMGRKALVPYGLYQAHGFFNPHFAKQTGVSDEDLGLFWQALQEMWDLDHSSSRGLMACQALHVFTHESSLGNAPAHRLFARVKIARHSDVIAPRSFSDYDVVVNSTEMPHGVTLTRLVG